MTDISAPTRVFVAVGSNEPRCIFSFDLKVGEHFPEAPEFGPMMLDQDSLYAELAKAFREAASHLDPQTGTP